MSPTGLITHSCCLAHATPPGHPECAARLDAVLRGLEGREFQSLARLDAPLASKDTLLLAHDGPLVDSILEAKIAEGGFLRIDADTAMSPGSAAAARYAAGAVIMAVDEVSGGRLQNAFCAIRPPGHHAERSGAMGFCLFNNIAIGALHARSRRGAKRVAVVDFDVHHGNGTQDIFFHDANLFYASTHQFPLYPGTGAPSERGVADNIVNAPLAPGTGSREFRAALLDRVLPALENFGPEFIFISAGFDAHRDDPLAGLCLNESDFAWATLVLCEVAARHCAGRVVSALEGGYDLDALASCAAAHVRALMAA